MRLQGPPRPTTRFADTVTVFDTVRTTVVDTVHVRITDTLGVVLAAEESDWKTALSVVVAIGSLVAGLAAAVAAWRAATASKENAAAAIATADASAKQATVAEQQAQVILEQQAATREATRLSTQRLALSLKSLCRRIRIPLLQLSVPGPNHQQLFSYSLLENADIERLEELARSVDAEAISSAEKAAVSLRVIAGMIKKAKGIDLGQGWVPTAQEVADWGTARSGADASLVQLEDVCERIAAC